MAKEVKEFIQEQLMQLAEREKAIHVELKQIAIKRSYLIELFPSASVEGSQVPTVNQLSNLSGRDRQIVDALTHLGKFSKNKEIIAYIRKNHDIGVTDHILSNAYDRAGKKGIIEKIKINNWNVNTFYGLPSFMKDGKILKEHMYDENEVEHKK